MIIHAAKAIDNIYLSMSPKQVLWIRLVFMGMYSHMARYWQPELNIFNLQWSFALDVKRGRIKLTAYFGHRRQQKKGMANQACQALPTEGWNIVLTTFLGLFISFIASTTNALTILAIFKKRALHFVTYYFIASLAVGDFLVGIVALPLWMARSLLKVADEEDPLSFAVRCFYFFFVGISTYNLCTLSLERYVGVILPLRYNEIVTVRRFQYAVASVWVLSGITACLCFAIHEDTYWFVAVFAVFFMPGIVISYCYVCIFKETYRHPRANEQLQADSGSTNQTHNRKASLTIAVVIGVFYMTTLPALAFSIHEVVSGKNAPCQTKKTLESWGTWALFLAYSNAAINPWIYAVRKREFRDALKILMFWKH